MQGYKIDLDGGVYGDGTITIPFLSILENILLGGVNDSTADIVKASLIYEQLQENKTSKTEGKFWWADEANFNFIRERLQNHKWGKPETINPVLTKLGIARFCQKLLETKAEPVPGT